LWGLLPRPGTARVFIYRNARDIADTVRLDKDKTEGLEPKVADTLVCMIAEASGDKRACCRAEPEE
jgi:hypothetical protein